MCEYGDDPDSTSRSHIHRAIQRATNPYAPHIPGKISTRKLNRNVAEKLLEAERNRSRKSLNAARIACHGYITGTRSVSVIAAQEIRSSVGRSRRWSGTEHTDATNKKVLSECMPQESHKDAKLSYRFRSVSNPTTSAETAYHRTVCQMLSGKGSRSSYDHVAKVLSRPIHVPKKPSKMDTISSSMPCKTSNTDLPHISKSRNENLEQSHAGNIPFYRIQNESCLSNSNFQPCLPDWALRYSTKVKSNTGGEQATTYATLPTRSKSVPKKQLKSLNLSKVCAILSDPNLRIQGKESQTGSRLTGRKQATHRAIEAYFKREKPIDKSSSKFVVVHMPNPNTISSDNVEYAKQAPRPRLCMRTGDKSSLRSLLTETEPNQSIPHISYPHSPFCRVNVRQFLYSRQISKATKT